MKLQVSPEATLVAKLFCPQADSFEWFLLLIRIFIFHEKKSQANGVVLPEDFTVV